MTAHLEEATFPAEAASDLDARALRVLARRRAPGPVKGRGRLVRRALIAADLIALLAAFGIVLLAMGPVESRFGEAAELGLFCITLPFWVLIAKLYGLYARDDERTDHTTADDAGSIFHLVTTGTWLVFIVTSLPGTGDPDLTRLVVFWGLAFGVVVLSRAVARALFRRHAGFLQNTIILGTDEMAQVIAKKFLSHPEYGINVVGFVDTESPAHESLEVLGRPEELPGIVRALDVERVVVAFPGEPRQGTMETVRTLSDMGVQIDIVPRFHDIVGPGVDVYTVEGVPLLGLRPITLSRTARAAKRTIDLVGASLVLLLMAPALAVVATMIKVDSPGPVFFRQVRMGAGGRYFRIWKFRTMIDGADKQKARLAHLNHHARNGDPRLFKIHDDPRVTRAGRFLRLHFLDEFPQLFNVLQGDMSLVGPRPLILSEAEHVNEWALARLNLRPGMTGLWQVLGGSAISFGEMVKLDYLYVTNWSLWNDVRLLFQTIPVVFRGARFK